MILIVKLIIVITIYKGIKQIAYFSPFITFDELLGEQHAADTYTTGASF
jgi:hypothetical protein